MHPAAGYHHVTAWIHITVLTSWKWSRRISVWNLSSCICLLSVNDFHTSLHDIQNVIENVTTVCHYLHSEWFLWGHVVLRDCISSLCLRMLLLLFHYIQRNYIVQYSHYEQIIKCFKCPYSLHHVNKIKYNQKWDLLHVLSCLPFFLPFFSFVIRSQTPGVSKMLSREIRRIVPFLQYSVLSVPLGLTSNLSKGALSCTCLSRDD